METDVILITGSDYKLWLESGNFLIQKPTTQEPWPSFKLLLPLANEVCEGYVFTRVCLSTGGSTWAGIPPEPGTPASSDQVHHNPQTRYTPPRPSTPPHRMHSSSMRTAHSLTIGGVPTWWVHLLGGVPAQEFAYPGVFLQGGYLPRGVYLPMGVYLSGRCTYLGGVPAWGVYLPGVVYLPRGCTCLGYLPPVNRILDTCY